MWYVAHGYFAYVNETSFAYPEHLVHEGVAVSSVLKAKWDPLFLFIIIAEPPIGIKWKDSLPYPLSNGHTLEVFRLCLADSSVLQLIIFPNLAVSNRCPPRKL